MARRKRPVLRVLAIMTCCASSSFAQTTDVPRLADGGIDLDAVYSTLSVQTPLYTNGARGAFQGSMLGRPFEASFSGDILSSEFRLDLTSTGLSEEAVFVTATLITDIICLSEEKRACKVRWRATASRTGDTWSVLTSCSQESRPLVTGDS